MSHEFWPAVRAGSSVVSSPLSAAAREESLVLSEAARYTLLAALTVAIGSCIRGQLLLALGLPVTVGALACAAHALGYLPGRRPPTSAAIPTGASALDSRPLIVGGLLLVSAVGVVAPIVGGPTYDLLKRGYYLAGCLAVWLWGYGDRRHRPRIVLAVAMATAALQMTTPLFVPDPFIDSWAWTQSCLRAMAHGIHPYTLTPADIVHGAFYRTGSAPRYPYMPATLLIYYPSFAMLGDYRFMLALCGPLTWWMTLLIGRRLRVPADVIDAALLTLMLHPRGFTLVAFGWSEPVLAVTIAAFALASVYYPGRLVQSVAILALPALKQYALVPTLWFLWSRGMQARRAVAWAVVIVSLSVVPFLWWNAGATLAGVLSEMSASATPSLRSTSLVASIWATTGSFPSPWLAPAMQLALGAYAYHRLRDTGLGGLLLGSGLALLATFLSAWQAFVNYFHPVIVCFALAGLVFSARDERGAPQAITEY